MLARAVKPNCDGLHDVAKQLLIWALNGKRKFGLQNGGKLYRYNEEYDFRSKIQRFGDRRNFDFNENLRKINWDNVELKPFTKNFYVPQPAVLERSTEEIQEFLKSNEIKIKGKDCPAPIFSFEEAGLSEKLMEIIRNLGFSKPTPIQSQGMPIALSGQNMVGVARTGSGKTLAFMLPAVIHIEHQSRLDENDGPIALVLAPTRELVQQIQNTTRPFARALMLNSVAVHGGSHRLRQEDQLRSGVEICVATPGRLLDFLNSETTNLKRCTYLVLDEADRMFDMGFEPQIRKIIDQIRPDRQVLMWSATWPKEIRSLAEEYLKSYIQLNVGSLNLTANPNINQIVHVCSEHNKKDLLDTILKKIMETDDNKSLIFASTKKKADYISFMLNSMGYTSDSLHGGKTQRERDIILNAFRNGRFSLLVATDVAARGLDVSDIRYVINYDYPSSVEDYIHRIGRTGRHDASGTSYTFLTEEDWNKAKDLITVLRDANQEVPPELENLSYPRNSYGYEDRRRGSGKYNYNRWSNRRF